MLPQYVVVVLKVENIISGWLSSGKMMAPKWDKYSYKQDICIYICSKQTSGVTAGSLFFIAYFNYFSLYPASWYYSEFRHLPPKTPFQPLGRLEGGRASRRSCTRPYVPASVRARHQ